MPCSFPPPLTDDQFTAALDGEVSLPVQQHLAMCPGCAARLTQARQVEQMLKSKLRRWDCPTSQQIGHYHLGLTSQTEARSIAEHLSQCVACQAELSELQT